MSPLTHDRTWIWSCENMYLQNPNVNVFQDSKALKQCQRGKKKKQLIFFKVYPGN